MRTIRLAFTDMVPSICDFFVDWLSEEYVVERNDDDPEILIFGDKNFGNNNLSQKYLNPKIARVFYTGENERPNQYYHHYSISFDHDEGKNFRLPLYVIYDHDNKKKGLPTIHNRASGPPVTERKFCSFVVKNGGCGFRNEMFHRLSAYKQVDAGGPLFNNIGYVLEKGDNACQAKAAFLPNYKFNLCFENSSYPGYTTEKLYEALVFGTVPLYWGSPTVGIDFNPGAFISWHDFEDTEKFIDYIKQVDSDDALWKFHFDQHLIHESYRPYKFFRKERFLSWWKSTVMSGF